MKSSIVKHKEPDTFKPITLEITFETRDEVLCMLQRLNLPASVVDSDKASGLLVRGNVEHCIVPVNDESIMGIWVAMSKPLLNHLFGKQYSPMCDV